MNYSVVPSYVTFEQVAIDGKRGLRDNGFSRITLEKFSCELLLEITINEDGSITRTTNSIYVYVELYTNSLRFQKSDPGAFHKAFMESDGPVNIDGSLRSVYGMWGSVLSIVSDDQKTLRNVRIITLTITPTSINGIRVDW